RVDRGLALASALKIPAGINRMASETFDQETRLPPKPKFEAPAERMAAGGELMALRGVTRHFRTRRHDTLAIDRISLSVNEAEFVCIVGPSGCGRSPLLTILAVPTLPAGCESL